MADISDVDTTGVEPNTGYNPIPKGDYDAVITTSERKATKAGDGHLLKLTFQILNGEYQNRLLWVNLNLWNKSEQAVSIAKKDFEAIKRAVGVVNPKDSAELHGKPLKISVKVKDQENSVGGYKPRNAGPATPPTTPVPAANQVPW